MSVARRRDKDLSAQLDAFAPIDRPGPLRNRVLAQLRDLIIGWVLRPGDHLVESELAHQLGVSRGPVREALQALQAEGWVDRQVGRGAFVHVPTATEVDEIFVVRAALEADATGLAAAGMDPLIARELRDVCEAGRTAVEAGDFAAAAAANSKFHIRIAELSGVRLLSDHIRTLDLRVRWLYRPLVPVRRLDSWIEHEAIVDALEAGEGDKAADLMRAHSNRTRMAYREQWSKLGEDGSVNA